MKGDWGMELPIWVSRKNADGMISQFSVPMWLFMLIGLLVVLNVVLWGGIGLYEAVTYII
jgi:hypothetical protein